MALNIPIASPTVSFESLENYSSPMNYRLEKEAGEVAAGLGGGGEGLESEINVCLSSIPSGNHQTDYNEPHGS